MAHVDISEFIPDAHKPAPDMSFIKRQFLNQAYAKKSSHQKMDLFLPNEGEGPFPVVAFFHGGGFRSGDKRDEQLTSVLKVLDNGFALATINYRLAPKALFADQIADAQAAIRFLRTSADEYQLDGRVVAWGASSGGYLTAYLGTLTGHNSALESSRKTADADQEARAAAHDDDAARKEGLADVAAVVSWFAPIDPTEPIQKDGDGAAAPPVVNEEDALDDVGTSPVDDSMQEFLLKYFGGDPQQDPALAKQVKPLSYLTPDTPPFYVQHGQNDVIVSPEQSIVFAEELRAVLGNSRVQFDILPGAKHGGEPFYTQENIKRICTFIRQFID